MGKEKTKKMLYLGTAIIVATILCIQTTAISDTKETHKTGMAGWSDNFDTYENGQFLEGTADDGGWVAWDEDPTFGAYVTNEISYSPPNSLDCVGDVDLVHTWDEFTSGVWNFSTYLYCPDDFEGESYFIMLSVYYPGGGQEGNRWAVQLSMSSFDGVIESEHQGYYLPLVTGDWVRFLMVIDLNSDWVDMYYGGQLLDYREWTAGPNLLMNGELEIKCLDIFANGATSVYWDNVYILEFGSEPTADLVASGDLAWPAAPAGGTLTSQITVANGVPATMLDWEIESYPDFGTWTFEPSSGEDLTGTTTVDVTVVAPAEDGEFSGEVVIANTESSADKVTIPVTLVTPKSKSINTPIIEFLEQHPRMFPLLRQLIGL
jgi:hypothetical protein